jgi:hypothetical protein
MCMVNLSLYLIMYCAMDADEGVNVPRMYPRFLASALFTGKDSGRQF